MELPPVRARRVSTPSSVLASMLNNIYSCSSTFVELYNQKYNRTTYLLMATWFASVFVFHGLTIYISEYSKEVEANYYNRLTVSLFSVFFVSKIIFKTCLIDCSFSLASFLLHTKKNIQRSPNSTAPIGTRIFKHHWITRYLINATLKIAHFDDCS